MRNKESEKGGGEKDEDKAEAEEKEGQRGGRGDRQRWTKRQAEVDEEGDEGGTKRRRQQQEEKEEEEETGKKWRTRSSNERKLCSWPSSKKVETRGRERMRGGRRRNRGLGLRNSTEGRRGILRKKTRRSSRRRG